MTCITKWQIKRHTSCKKDFRTSHFCRFKFLIQGIFDNNHFINLNTCYALALSGTKFFRPSKREEKIYHHGIEPESCFETVIRITWSLAFTYAISIPKFSIAKGLREVCLLRTPRVFAAAFFLRLNTEQIQTDQSEYHLHNATI